MSTKVISGMEVMHSLQGRVIIPSNPAQSIFGRAVIYICIHDENGAIGVVVNKVIGPIRIRDVADPSRMLNSVKSKRIDKEYIVHYGGPFDNGRFVILSASKTKEPSVPYGIRISLLDGVDKFLYDYLNGLHSNKFIIAKGLAAWEPDELEKQLAKNEWIIIDKMDTNVIFRENCDKWALALASLGVSDIGKFVNYVGNA